MFVVEQNRKIIFDMRHYGIYTMDKVLLAYPKKEGFSMPLILGEFETQKLCNDTAIEIKKMLTKYKSTGEPFIYRVPNNIKEYGGKDNEKTK